MDRGRLEREIVGALRSSIAAHGPITWENAPSAGKRVIAALKSLGVFRGERFVWREGDTVPAKQGEEPGRPTQTTPAGEEIPVPTRGEFDAMVRKVAPPAGRKRPAATDEPRERSE